MASAGSTLQTLVKRSQDTALMPPPPPPKRIKRPAKVLDEDKYTSALDHIVKRDFYPGLLAMEAQEEYINALDSHNNNWIAEAGRRLTYIMTPGRDGRRVYGKRGTSMTPLVSRAEETPRGWGGETPISVAGTEATSSAEQLEEEKIRTMGLNAFQAKYTSEDNESFNTLLDKQNQKRAEKYAWMYNGNKIPAGRQIAHRARETKLLEAAEGPQRVKNNDRALVRREPEKEADKDTRKAMPDHKPSAPRNALMFTPDSIEDTQITVVQAAEATSKAPPRSIVYNNTRLPLPSTDMDADIIPPSPSISAINDAIAGRPRPTDSEPGYTGSETPRVNGYAFVDEEDPEPEPTSEADRSLLQRLGVTADASPNPFKINAASHREELHHRLVDKTAKSKRDSANGPVNRLAALKGEAAVGGKTPTPKFASSPVVGGKARGNLTPAAQRLFNRMGTPQQDGGFGAFGAAASRTPAAKEGNRARWTPTPRVKRAV